MAVAAVEQEPAVAPILSDDLQTTTEDPKVKKRGKGVDDTDDVQRKKVHFIVFI